MSDVTAPAALDTVSAEPARPPSPAPAAPVTPAGRRYDRSIVEGPLTAAVWKIAWPTMLTNLIGGVQGMIDHVLVGHLVGFSAGYLLTWAVYYRESSPGVQSGRPLLMPIVGSGVLGLAVGGQL